MKREILFRGKNKETGKWKYGSLLVSKEGQCFILMPDSGCSSEVSPETVGEFTGLVDKNGTKIFEGDICSTDLGRPYNVVKFSHGCFVFSCNDGRGEYEDTMIPLHGEDGVVPWTEVVGNIYDNPEFNTDARMDGEYDG